MNNIYDWTDNPTVSGVALCDTDVLNDCLMHLKYDNEKGNGFSLFDIVAKDHVLGFEESNGFAELGSYVYNEALTGRYGYPDFYNKCLEEFQDSVQETITVGSHNFSGYKNSNGHIFYNIADKDVIDSIYDSTGAAWYYGIDTENERIFLPRNDWFFQNGSTQNVGKFVEAGLPNITGSFLADDYDEPTGAFYRTGSTTGDGGSNGGAYIINFDASRSNPIYGKSDTVQPPAVNVVFYMVVGNISNVVSTTVELTSNSAEAPITFDSETNAVKLSIGDGLSVDSDGNLTGLTNKQAMDACMPDYSAGVSILSNSSYTCPCNGWLFLGAGLNKYVYYKSSLFTVQPYNSTYVGAGSSSGITTYMYPVEKNEVLTRVAYSDDQYTQAIFFPSKGATNA